MGLGGYRSHLEVLEKRKISFHSSNPEPSIPYLSRYSDYDIPAPSIGKGKGKAVSLQAWSSPEGSRKLRFPDFMTTAQDGGKVVSLMHRPPLPPGNTPGTYFC